MFLNLDAEHQDVNKTVVIKISVHLKSRQRKAVLHSVNWYSLKIKFYVLQTAFVLTISFVTIHGIQPNCLSNPLITFVWTNGDVLQSVFWYSQELRLSVLQTDFILTVWFVRIHSIHSIQLITSSTASNPTVTFVFSDVDVRICFNWWWLVFTGAKIVSTAESVQTAGSADASQS